MSYSNRQGPYGFNDNPPLYSNNSDSPFGPSSRTPNRRGGFSSMNNQPLPRAPPPPTISLPSNNRGNQGYGSYSTSYPAPGSNQQYRDESNYGSNTIVSSSRDNDSRKNFFQNQSTNSDDYGYGYGPQPSRNQSSSMNDYSGYGEHEQQSQRSPNDFYSGSNNAPFPSNSTQQTPGKHPGTTRGRGVTRGTGFGRGSQNGTSRFSSQSGPQSNYGEPKFNVGKQSTPIRPAAPVQRNAPNSGFSKPSFENVKKPAQPLAVAVNSPKPLPTASKPIVNPPAAKVSSEETKFSGRCRLYVRNLPPNFSGPELVELFTRFGELRIEQSNKEQGFAYVCLDYWRNAEKAKKELDSSVFKGKVIKVRHATQYTAVKVNNLSSYISNELLRDAFSQFGEIERAVVIANEQGLTTGEGLVEFTRKTGAEAAVKGCTEKCFFLTATPQPVIVEAFQDIDDIGGVSDKCLPTRNTDYVKERQKRPRFAEPNTFEATYGLKLKELFESHHAKIEALEKEYKDEERKMLTQMESARSEHETSILREQLRLKEIEIRERQQVVEVKPSEPNQQVSDTTKQSQDQQNIPASQPAKEGDGKAAQAGSVNADVQSAITDKQNQPEASKTSEVQSSALEVQSKKSQPPKAAIRPQQKKNPSVTPAKARPGRRGRGRPGFGPGHGNSFRGGYNFSDDVRGPMDFHMDSGNFMSFEGNFEPPFMGPSPQRRRGQGPGGPYWSPSPYQPPFDDSFVPNKRRRFF